MSDLVNRAVANALRTVMFPDLPQDVRAMFAEVEDPLLGSGPNIRVGHLSEFGLNPNFPLISVFSEGAVEALTRSTLRHLTVSVDYWVSQDNAGRSGSRRVVAILYEYARRTLQDANFSGGGIAVHRCYEIRASDIMFEAPEKLYHIANAYRVEAVSNSGAWY